VRSLGEFVLANEEYLASRVLRSFRKHEGSADTMPEDFWRASVRNLADALTHALDPAGTLSDTSPDDPAVSLGIAEARKHRLPGTSPGIFLGLLKHARGVLTDLVAERQADPADPGELRGWLLHFFDRAEIAFCTEWAGLEKDAATAGLRKINRRLANEKSLAFAVFESLANPVILFDSRNEVINLNYAAAELFATEEGADSPGKGEPDSRWIPEWMSDAVHDFAAGSDTESISEHSTSTPAAVRHFEMHLTRTLDVGDRIEGTAAELTEITSRKQGEEAKSRLIMELQEALAKVKTLSGLLPICASCKQIRDDQGYWNNLESFIHEHSGASFSHGICPECASEFERKCDMSETG
jgi:hypothetical protein